MFTIFLVFRSPSMVCRPIKLKNSKMSSATEEGKETELKLIKLSTPQHASKIHRTPIGTYIQAVTVRRHAIWTIWILDK